MRAVSMPQVATPPLITETIVSIQPAPIPAADAPDAVLLSAARTPGMIDRARQMAAAAYRAARAVPGAPWNRIDADWSAACARLRSIPPSDGRPNSAADQAHAIASLRTVLQTIAHFDAIAADLRQMPEADRKAALAVDAMQAEQARHAAWRMVRGLDTGRPKVSPAEFCSALHLRGIVVVATEEGGLLARPAALLTDADRDLLKQHKAAIVAHLSDTLAIA